MKYLFLCPDHDYDKLFFFLKDCGLSTSLISALRRDENSIKICGETANMRSRVFAGQKVEICVEDHENSAIPFNDIPLEILFEDEDLIVVNKPAGIPTIPSKRHFEDNLAGAVCKHVLARQPHFVFRALGRLDKDTSGIVVIAKNQYAATMAKIEKRYEAICTGSLSYKPDNFDICVPIETVVESGINKQKRQTSQSGKPATTHVHVIKNFAKFSHISLTLLQGRTHQIRVHMSSIGHPLVGDNVYGEEKEASLAKRTLLHCAEAKITFSGSKQSLNITAPLPYDFALFLNNCKN